MKSENAGTRLRGGIAKIGKKIWNETLLYTLLAIFIGLLVGAIILLVSGFNPFEAYGRLFSGAMGTAKSRAYTVQYATPIIFTGLSVAFAFKTGLFNIGAEGQYIVGALAAIICGVWLPLPAGLHGLVCLIAGAAAGALWGAIAGFLKAWRGISEVIVTIMLNWIGFYLSNYLCMSPLLKKPESTASVDIAETARISTGMFSGRYGNVDIHFGMLLAVVAVIVIWYIVNRTTLGYRLRAVGFNRHAAEYGGISVKGSFMTSMGIAGMLAGLGGAAQVCGVIGRISQLGNQEGYGFDGLSVAMIGASSPIGVLFSGLFFGGMKYGGSKLTLMNVPPELVNVVIGAILYAIAIMGAFRLIVKHIKAKKGGALR